MQTYSKAGCANAVVDFAHTPDALHNVLATLKKQTQGKLAVVFGCGGNRDASKRPHMTAIAQAIADRVILTADNPRKENLENIIADMQSNLDAASKALMTVELDRSKAIELALAELNEQDILLIAGKGHEAYQDVDGIKHPYSDEATLLSLGYQDVALQIESIKKESIKEVL